MSERRGGGREKGTGIPGLISPMSSKAIRAEICQGKPHLWEFKGYSVKSRWIRKYSSFKKQINSCVPRKGSFSLAQFNLAALFHFRLVHELSFELLSSTQACADLKDVREARLSECTHCRLGHTGVSSRAREPPRRVLVAALNKWLRPKRHMK